MKNDVVDRLRVASPCPISWEKMNGNDRVRFCQLCNLSVYNIAELTRREATALIAETEGRICARLFRRTDGTVITRDCPVGLRAIRRRVARQTAAVFAALTSICASAFSYPASRATSTGSTVANSVVRNAVYSAELSGVITDPTGQPVAGALVTLTNLQTNRKRETKSDKKGKYSFLVSDFGRYRLQVTAEFFNVFDQEVTLHAGDELRFDVSLMAGLVGVIVIEPVRERSFEINGVRIRIN